MFWQRFYDLCDHMGSKPNPVAKKVGISSATVTQWKQGSSPSGDNLVKIADELDCSVDYLLGRTDDPIVNKSKSDRNLGMNEDERKLLAGYRELNEEGQKQALIYVTEFLLQNARFTQKSHSDDIEKAQ